jgi:hypothetical protein
MTTAQIQAESAQRGITRLCHFTPLRNLVHIASDDEGLLSTAFLTAAERREFNPQDLLRLDQHPDYVSCSIQYPNAYYLRSKRNNANGEARLFPQWVCLLLKPDHLWDPRTKVCAHNAATGGGVHVGEGFEAFKHLFADTIIGPRGDTWRRARHPDNYPTDAQAEVLVFRQIPRADIIGIVVEDEAQAGDTYARLQQLTAPVDQFSWVIAPAFYDPAWLTPGLRGGVKPVELPWTPKLPERLQSA